MPVPEKVKRISVEDYLANEERAIIKNEYVDGRLFAMTGTTLRHNIIAGNLMAILRAHIKGSKSSNCRVYMADVKVHVKATNSFYYPDVMVTCGSTKDTSMFSEKPVLIVEVISRTTASIDRREKVTSYRQLESLKEYLIVHQRKKCVELHRRGVDGDWEVVEFKRADELELRSMPCGVLNVLVDSIYEDTDIQNSDPLVNEPGADYYFTIGDCDEEDGDIDW